MIPTMDSPSGIDIRPEPPTAVRVKRIVGILAFVAVGVIVVMIIYGVYSRHQRQVQAFATGDGDRKAVPATLASQEFIGGVPELKPAPPLESPSLEAKSTGVREAAPARSASQILAVPAPIAPSLIPMNQVADQDRRAAQKELEAIEAPTGIAGSGRSFSPKMDFVSGGVPAANTSTSVIVDPARPALGVAVPSGDHLRASFTGMSPAAEYATQNDQDEKKAFIQDARNRAPQNYLQAVRTAPLSRFEIKAGWQIPAITEQAINSDEPGDLRALVRENIYDTATGKYILIPQGSRLFGHYNSVVSYGQDGVQAVWDRVIFPDGSSLNLDGMIGEDARGASGLRFSVDHHYGRLLGFAVLTSLFSAGVQLSQPRSGTILAVPSNGEIVGSAVGGQLSQLGAETFRRQLNVQPTIKIPAGYRFNVSVNRDITFDSPYSPR
jgi:type IV secretion system protein VirB10